MQKYNTVQDYSLVMQLVVDAGVATRANVTFVHDGKEVGWGPNPQQFVWKGVYATSCTTDADRAMDGDL